MKLFGVSRLSAHNSEADALYRVIVTQARSPRFYTGCGVPDTPDGRYDLIVLHVVLVLRRLHRAPEETRKLAQAVFDLLFSDMDQNLREMGVGDLAVGKRIKAIAKGFYGRLAAYDGALTSADEEALAAALRRNLYRHADPPQRQVEAVAAYMGREAARLDERPLEELVAGRLGFGAAPDPEPTCFAVAEEKEHASDG